jgi:hypothetical protein
MWTIEGFSAFQELIFTLWCKYGKSPIMPSKTKPTGHRGKTSKKKGIVMAVV